MMYTSSLSVFLLVSGVLASPAPKPTPAPSPVEVARSLHKRASCTFSGDDGYSSASASKKDCATIVLSALTVPSGVTLDMTDLEDGTTVSKARSLLHTWSLFLSMAN